MTEEQAKTKWCPFVRMVTTENGSVSVRSDAPAGYNRYSGDSNRFADASACIGSACMAWRRHAVEAFDTVDASEDGGGYCGLAGPVQ